jgi:acyl-CoA thioester hydrolase
VLITEKTGETWGDVEKSAFQWKSGDEIRSLSDTERDCLMPVTTEIRVRYAETDQMGVVYYANYLVWFEVGRVELFRALGFSYKLLESEFHCILPVVEARCRYRYSARYDEQILIETRPMVVRGSVVRFVYRILRKAEDGAEPALLAEGETTHIVCDAQMNKKPFPQKYAAALRTMMDAPKTPAHR